MTNAQGFPAFPADRRDGRAFARSWWGRAWIQAAEDAALESEALKNGRKYASAGRVGSITVSPGLLSAPVYGEGDTYRTAVALQPLTDAQWDRFLAQVAARAGHIAALLDRDMPPDLVAAAEDVGVPLLPGLGDLDPSCDCEDWGHPCRHAAALAYQAAWLIDEDPFLLLLLRGRGEAEFLAALQQRGTDRAAGAAADAPRHGRIGRTVPAADVYATAPAVLPGDPEPPDRPGAMPVIPDGDGVDAAVLRLLAHDAAVRALGLITEAEGGAAAAWLDERADGVRLAALYGEAGEERADTVAPGLAADGYARLRAGHDRAADFDRAVAAWRFGGVGGLDVLDRAWTPGRGELARAKQEFALWSGDEDAVGEGVGFRVWRNRWTDEQSGVQLRLGPDGRWYPYRARGGEWWPAGHPDRDAASALDAA